MLFGGDDMTAAKQRKAAAGKGSAPRRAATRPHSNGAVPVSNGALPHPADAAEVRAPEQFVPTVTPVGAPTVAAPARPAAEVPEHPYGDKKIFVYRPKAGGAPIVFPHISTCEPTTLFFYDNRKKDQMEQAFAWMDLCGIPDAIGRRVFMLPAEEQGSCLQQWFSGLSLTPQQEVAPPGES